MAAEQRKLLEQLMGEQLMNGPGTSRAPQLAITDPKVCRSYLVGTCPHDLFTNTRKDSGPCPRVHKEALKAEYEAGDPEQKKNWAFEYDYLRDMQKYIDECNRNIDIAQRKLEKTPEEIRQTMSLLKQISDYTKTVEIGLDEIKTLAILGNIGMAVTEHLKLRQTQQIKSDRERELKALSDTGGPSGHQKLQVCDVCGAYLSRLDNDRRLADHFYGKMHLGYAQMRKTYETLQKELRGRPMPSRDESAQAFGRGDGDQQWGGGGGGGGRGRGGYRGGGFRGRGRGQYGRW
ncbi:MAG: splicing factor [Alyxoria varia]|nr:MAG: splicing factor [Alyxoria varia]